MPKVRFLEGAYIPSLKNSYNFSDEVELEQGMAERLAAKGTVDILADPQPGEEKKPQRKKRKTKKEIEAEAAEQEQSEEESKPEDTEE